jgi:hypothetical protein
VANLAESVVGPVAVKLASKELNAALGEIRNAFEQLPLAFRFCSMSEQYCRIGGGRFDKVTDLIKRKRNIPNHIPEPFPEALFRKWFAECK